MNNAHPATQIVVDTEVPLVRIVREFAAPPDRVFRAHTDPALFAQWIGPRGNQAHVVDLFDCHTGGAYRYEIRHPGFAAGFFGSFHEVRPSSLIVQTFCFEGMRDGVALERLVFEAIADGRTRLSVTSLVDSFAARDAFVASGMETGVVDGYERLDEVLAG